MDVWYQEMYVDLNLSSSVVGLVMNFWSKGTEKQYSSHINRRLNYCIGHNIDPFDSSVNEGAEFLVEYVHEGVSYSTVNTAKLALFYVFPAKDGTPFGKQPYCKVIERYV